MPRRTHATWENGRLAGWTPACLALIACPIVLCIKPLAAIVPPPRCDEHEAWLLSDSVKSNGT